MTHMEKAVALRGDPNVHYNCAQTVLMTFAEDIGITDKQAFDLTLDFNLGMGHGFVCGALTGALMAMGGLGLPQDKRREIVAAFTADHGDRDCAPLLKAVADRGGERKPHCDALVYWCVDYICKEAGLDREG